LSGLLSTHISALESKVAEAKRNAKRAYDKRDNGIAITGAATIVAAVFFPALAPVILAKGISYSVIKDQTGDGKPTYYQAFSFVQCKLQSLSDCRQTTKIFETKQWLLKRLRLL